MVRTLLPAAVLAAAVFAGSAEAQIGVGSVAPEIEAKEWFNPPAGGTSLEELRGRVVFVEFWATW